MISVTTAGKLLDFGGRVSPAVAEEQLQGAVGLHNVLERERIAYLADEVGMGKTYVALGAIALFRHYDPTFRVLVIAPRENIQQKWIKELKTFTGRCVRFADLRVRAAHGAPARAPVFCGNLIELVRETTTDPDRDFFARLTSFSLPLGKDAQGWREKRDQLLEHVPWLDKNLFDLRRRDEFKANFASAVCCALPSFDLVVIDEGHNMKGGLDASSRNRVLSLALGHPDVQPDRAFRGYGRRAKRVLILSATPLENDYRHLWNQLDVVGHGKAWADLASPDAQDSEKRAAAQRFLIRRVTRLNVGDELLTKNLYRREWRGGGVAEHDTPLKVPGDKALLSVALVQKKVSELVGERFNNSFQIGMLASFESFLETARVARRKDDDSDEAPSNFDDASQTDHEEERAGVDVHSVNSLARSYRNAFGEELPHPKMDAVVDRLCDAVTTGEKALVFVRRVASVTELRAKLEERYDAVLLARLERELGSTFDELRPHVETYRRERADALHRRLRRPARPVSEQSDVDEASPDDDVPDIDDGGSETFFAWYFRGEGPPRVFSGAALQKRLSGTSGQYATLFDENHVAALLNVEPARTVEALVSAVGKSTESVVRELGSMAAQLLPRRKTQRREMYFAVQQAALQLLASAPGDIASRAAIVRQERYTRSGSPHAAEGEIPDIVSLLQQSTFFTALRARSSLQHRLWPLSREPDFRKAFREAELRRELLSSQCRLGHAFIDLYVLTVIRRGTLRLGGARDEEDDFDLGEAFLDRLETQASDTSKDFTSFRELADAADNFDLILDVNVPNVREPVFTLAEASREFGRLLREQQPIGGMSGQVNATLVRQFRMPGYPFVLITTDLLQEGEDLHTFCSAIHHYGLSCMPSSMEQRTGRIDRVSSQTERRLVKLNRAPDGSELLQVHYPHLRETVEVIQVERVLERMNRFTRLMHEDLGAPEEEKGVIDIASEILKTRRDIAQIKEPLRSAFPVRDDSLGQEDRPLAVESHATAELLERFRSLRMGGLGAMDIAWEDRSPENALVGTASLGERRQAFTLLLRFVAGRPLVRCVSPIGEVRPEENLDEIVELAAGDGVRVAAVATDPRFETYDLAIEGDVLLATKEHDARRIGDLIRRVVTAADHVEKRLLERDEPLATFRTGLDAEAGYER